MHQNHDERQEWLNMKISRQALIMVLAIILVNGLIKSNIYGPWAEPMTEAFIIIALTSGYFITRSILNDAYLGTKDTLKKNITIFGLMSLMFFIIFFIEFSNRTFINEGMLSGDLTMLLAGIFFLYTTIIHAIKSFIID